jgi:hypothetical protein
MEKEYADAVVGEEHRRAAILEKRKAKKECLDADALADHERKARDERIANTEKGANKLANERQALVEEKHRRPRVFRGKGQVSSMQICEEANRVFFFFF